MQNKQSPSKEYRGFEMDQAADRVTATELIDGVQHLLVLEQDSTGCYREVILEPLTSSDRNAATHALL